ncbi:MAG: efflux transporter outer membrane subunit [Desulfuromonadaceae bacterium]|nr:efflux transporter outer membrane subunit [Desulfuromonadaceae bacterium]
MTREPPFNRGAAWLLSLLLALGGCTLGPDFIKPQAEVRDNWNERGDPRVATQTAVDRRWWSVFNDPTLDQLIQVASRQNLPLQIAGLRIMEARARLGLAIGGRYPQQQETFGSVTKFGLSQNTANGSGADRNHWDYQVGFDAIWELDFWGKFRRDVEASHADLTASVVDYDDALVSLTAEVARTYTVIRTNEVLIELAAENVQLQEEGLRIAESRFRNGVTTELDVTQAQTLLESTRAAIPQLQTQLRQAQNALTTLLGQPPGSVQTYLAERKGVPVAPVHVAVGVPAELLRRRPDIRSAELAAAAQCARIGIAQADLYPSFSLFGEFGFQTSGQGGMQSGHADLSNLWDAHSFFYSFGPRLKWPLFNYGRLKNQVRIQDARFQQLLVNYQNTVLKATQEVEDTLTGFLKAQEAAAFEQNAVNAARRSVGIALTQYKEGAADYQRVLDTQRALLQEQNNLTQTRSSIATNLIALYKALGGGWELRQGQPILAESTRIEMQKRTDWGRLLAPQPVAETSKQPSAREIPILQKPDW